MSPECLGFPAMNVMDTTSPCVTYPNVSCVLRLKRLRSEGSTLRGTQSYLSVCRINLLHDIAKTSVLGFPVHSCSHHKVEEFLKEWRLRASGQLWHIVLNKAISSTFIVWVNSNTKSFWLFWSFEFFWLFCVLRAIRTCLWGSATLCSKGCSGVYN